MTIKANEYSHQWKGEDCRVGAFQGVVLGDFEELEDEFQVNITVFSLRPDGRAETVRASTSEYGDSIFLNVWKDHLMLVRDVNAFSRAYSCPGCSRIFSRSDNLERHSSACRGEEAAVSQRKYVGGYVRYQPSIFERLEEVGISTGEDATYRWFCCFDTESILQPLELSSHESRSEKTCEHILVSVALSSNIPGFEEAVCFIEPEPTEVIRKMLQHLECMQEEASLLMREQLSETISLLDEMVQEAEQDGADEGRKKMRKIYRKLKTDLDLYVDQLSCVSFNGSAYDLPLISRQLLPELQMDTDPHAFVIKKGNTYMCIATSKYRFIDALLFLSGGTTYDGFLKTYTAERKDGGGGGDGPERKGYFPYEKLTSYDVLEEQAFPSYNDFYSKLKNCNTLESERLRFERLLTEGLTQEEALEKMGLTCIPLSGQEEYQETVGCKRMQKE